MIPNVEYIHTNLIAQDWRKLADFYVSVFGCEVASVERDLQGPWVEQLTGIPEATIKGVHLRLPGPAKTITLEIFEYNKTEVCSNTINRLGFAHIAFKVEDVGAALAEIIKFGGRHYGDVVTQTIYGLGLITVVYATDPEGNIIELQHVKKEK